jgi:hypothetical protein
MWSGETSEGDWKGYPVSSLFTSTVNRPNDQGIRREIQVQRQRAIHWSWDRQELSSTPMDPSLSQVCISLPSHGETTDEQATLKKDL